MADNKNRTVDLLRRADKKIIQLTDAAGNLMVNLFHQLALFAIGAATVWAAVAAFAGIMHKSHASLEDLLLLFIYLEVGAMVGIYFRTQRMPVRFLVYVAITALTRLMISQANHHENLNALNLVWISLAIILLSASVLIIRYGSSRYPSDSSGQKSKQPGGK